MPAQTIKTSEANVSKAIRDLLAAKKIMVFRMNAGDRFGETNGKKWRIAGHAAGTADLMAFPKKWTSTFVEHDADTLGHVVEVRLGPFPLWIEVKAPGKTQSKEQIEFQRAVENYGMTYLLADSVDTVIEWLRERGI